MTAPSGLFTPGVEAGACCVPGKVVLQAAPVPTGSGSGCGSGSGSGRASSSSTQGVAGVPDVEDTGLAPARLQQQLQRQQDAAVPAVPPATASLVLAPPSAVISIKHELQQHLQQQEMPAAAGGEIKVVIDSKERLRWSPQLHQRFCQAVDSLGGCAVAKPKDIVLRMGVQGLTLAHVKSHLQKYRQQEGVTFVAHAPRAPAVRRSHASSGYGDWEPAAKRARSGLPTAFSVSPPAPYAAGGVPSPDLWSTQQPPVLAPPVAVEPLQQFLQSLAGTAPVVAPAPLPAPLAAHPPQPPLLPPQLPAEATPPPPPLPEPQAQPQVQPASPAAHEHADKLLALADLALSQQDELAAQEGPLQEAAAALEGVGEQLQQAAQQPGSLGAEVEVVLAMQQELSAEVARHLAQQATLREQLAALQRSAKELLARPELAGAGKAQPTAASGTVGQPMSALEPAMAQQQQPLQQQQQQQLSAVAATALRMAAEQAAAPAPVLVSPAAPEQTGAPNLANLIAMVAAAAAANYAGGAPQLAALQQLPVAQPQPAAPALHNLALQQLYQLAARQAV